MDLQVEEVAELLNVSEATLHHWLEEGKIPAYRWEKQYRFNRAEIEEWLVRQQQPITSEVLEELSPKGNFQFSLYRALNRGEVLFPKGESKEEVVREVMEHMEASYGLDAELLTERFLERERRMSTALGHGVAIPHTRDFLLDTHYDLVVVAYPEKPLPFEAVDGQPVHLLFFLFACDDRHHLNLIAKMAHLHTDAETRSFFRAQPNKMRILNFVKAWEARLHKPLLG